MDVHDSTLSVDLLHHLFEYRDGNLYRKVKTSNRICAGQKAGWITNNGYEKVSVLGKKHFVHRLIFMMHHGQMPNNVDHIDGNRSNNKIENLREASVHQNALNMKISKANTSGAKGVSWSKSCNKWEVRVSVNCKPTRFGYYDDLELAELVACEARAKHHGIFSRDT